MNSYGVLHNYNQVPLYSPNYELVSNVLQYKQGNLDQNRGKLQSLLDNFEGLDVYKDVDRDYLENRIDLITQVSNKYATADLSDPGMVNAIKRNLGQIVDDNVKNAVMSTRVFRSEQKEWDDQRKKGDGKYHDKNHAYSMRASEAWRNSQQVGDTYKGGGGFKEYINVEKLLSDKIPDIAQKLKATYVVDGEGNGVFRASDTYEVIDRRRVEAALDGMLDQKAREQLKINAWSIYDQVPDNFLRDSYNATLNVKVDDKQKSLGKYKSLRAATTDPSKRAQYDELIQSAEAEIGSLKVSSFDAIGREEAYTTMYVNGFKENYLKAYSQEPTLIKHEVNELDKALRNYELSKADDERADKQLLLSAKKLELDTRKAQGKSLKQDANGNFIDEVETPDKKKTDPTLSRENAESASSLIARKQESSTNIMARVLSNQGITKDDLSDPGLVAQLKKGSAGRDKVNVKLTNGRTVTLDFTNKYVAQAVDDFNSNVLQDNGAKKAYYKTIDNLVQKTQFKLGTVLSKGGDVDPSSFPNYQEKLVSDGNGGYKVEKVKEGIGNYYSNLMKASKERSLTESEKATLDWYTHRHLLADPELDKSDRQMIFSKIDKDFRQKVSSGKDMMSDTWYQEYASQSYNLVQKSNSPTLITGGNSNVDKFLASKGLKDLSRYEWIPEGYSELYTLADKAMRGDEDAKKRLDFSIQSFNRKVGVKVKPSADYNLSDFNRNNLEWSDSAFSMDNSFSTGLQQDIRNKVGTVRAQIDSEYEKLNLNPSKVTYIFSNDRTPESFKAIQRQLGVTIDEKSPIDLVPVLNPSGVPSGEYLAGYKVKDKETGNWISKPLGTLNREQLQELGVNMAEGDRPRYDAIYGEFAPQVGLGDASITNLRNNDAENGSNRYARMRQTAQAVIGTPDLPFMSKREIVQYASQIDPQLAGTVDKMYSDAEKGIYTFKLESDGTQWNHAVYRGDKRVYSSPLGTRELSEDEVDEMKLNSQLYNQKTFSEFIAEEIEAFENTKSFNAY